MRNILLITATTALLLVGVWLLPEGYAGGCGSYYSQPTYYYPQYIDRVQYVDRIVPIAVPTPYTVAVPVVSYIWNGGYGVPGYSPVYGAQPATGMGTVQQPAQPQPQQQVQQPVQQPMQSARTVDTGAPRTSALLQLSDAELDLLIDKIEKRLAARANNGNSAPTQRAPTASPPPPVPQAKANGSYTDNDVIRVLTTKQGKTQKACMDCHTPPNVQGGMKIFNSPGVLNQSVNWTKVWDAADAGRMPKEAQTNKGCILSDADCDILRDKAVRAGATAGR